MMTARGEQWVKDLSDRTQRDPDHGSLRSQSHAERMHGIQIGYARVSTTDQDLTSQRDALLRMEFAMRTSPSITV